MTLSAVNAQILQHVNLLGPDPRSATRNTAHHGSVYKDSEYILDIAFLNTLLFKFRLFDVGH